MEIRFGMLLKLTCFLFISYARYRDVEFSVLLEVKYQECSYLKGKIRKFLDATVHPYTSSK